MILNGKPNLNTVYRKGYDLVSLDEGLSKLLFKRVERGLRRESGERQPQVIKQLQYPIDQLVKDIKESSWNALKLFSSEGQISETVKALDPKDIKLTEWQSDTFNQAVLGVIALPIEMRESVELSFAEEIGAGNLKVSSKVIDLSAPNRPIAIFYNPSNPLVQWRFNQEKGVFKPSLQCLFGEITDD